MSFDIWFSHKSTVRMEVPQESRRGETPRLRGTEGPRDRGLYRQVSYVYGLLNLVYFYEFYFSVVPFVIFELTSTGLAARSLYLAGRPVEVSEPRCNTICI